MARTRLRATLAAAAVAAATLAAVPTVAGAEPACPEPPEALQFGEMTYVDMNRAGGEPMIHTHPDGTLLYGSHAGTTHFFSPAAPDPTTAAFIENYKGQTYSYYSQDNGTTWNFVDRTLPPANLPSSGFSDPDYAIDTAGNVYLSEINLANVAVSKSSDAGQSFALQNFFGLTVSDRQWKEADEENVVYMVANAFAGGSTARPVGDIGHNLYKSTDGGATFSAGRPDGGGLGDIRVDQSDGTLYQALYTGGTLSMAAYRGIRGDDFTREVNTIAEGVRMLSHWPAFHLDPSGNLYIVWDESGTGAREAGIWFSSSTDRGLTWIDPVRLDEGPQTDIWPWLAVGDDGRVGAAWLGNDNELPDHDAEQAQPGVDPWHLYAAQSLNGLGCPGGQPPAFSRTKATTEPVHVGTICQGGTFCQAQAIDRRLGDYFSIEVDGTGAMVLAYSDTRQGGSVALPGFLRQSGGPSFFGPPLLPEEPEPVPTETPTGPGPVPSPEPTVSEPPAPEPEPEPEPGQVDRAAGVDRVDTAAKVSAATYAAADTIVLARSDDYADALTGAPLAVQEQAPLLLSAPDHLSAAAQQEIDRLGADQAILLGGESALQPQVADDLAEMGVTVRRVAGPNRYATAGKVFDELPASDEVYVAEGRNADPARGWPDALSASGIASSLGRPVLIVERDTVPPETEAKLSQDADATIIGGTAAVSDTAATRIDQLARTTERIQGENRYETSARVADRAVAEGVRPGTTWVATGRAFADGLVAGAAAGADNGVLLLIDGQDSAASPAGETWISDHASDIDRLRIAGGTSAVSTETEERLRGLLG